MIEIQISGLDTSGNHKCYAEKEGNEAVFRCPVCRDFERRINLITGKVKTRCNPENYTLHRGTWQSLGFELADQFYSPN